MKKTASFIFIFCILIAFCAPVFALDPVYENDKVIYDTKTKCWSKEENKEGIILYKKTSSGTGKQNGKIVVKSKGAESPQIQHFWKVTINQNICRT